MSVMKTLKPVIPFSCFIVWSEKSCIRTGLSTLACLQQISSIGGTIVVIIVLLSFKRNKDACYNPTWFMFWIYVSIITIMFVVIKFWMISNVFQTNIHYLVMMALTFLSSFFVGLCIVCFFFALVQKTFSKFK